MRPERDFGQYPPEASLFRASELVGSSRIEAELFASQAEVVLFSGIGKEDPKIPDRLPEANQTAEPTRTKPSGDWEPFSTNTEPDQKFINLYGGNYAEDMELNRRKVEQLISVSALQGVVVLESLSQARRRAIDINPDGSVTSKKRLFWGEKPEDKENPYHKITSIPEGWKIEICDQRIRDELSEKHSGEQLRKEFAESFNRHLREGIWEGVWNEKIKGQKDPFFRTKIITSLMFPAISTSLSASGGFTIYDLYSILPVLVGYAAINFSSRFQDKDLERLRQFIRTPKIGRNLESFYEYFMPRVEIDRVLRGFAFANLKGRNLIRVRENE